MMLFSFLYTKNIAMQVKNGPIESLKSEKVMSLNSFDAIGIKFEPINSIPIIRRSNEICFLVIIKVY